MLPVAIITLTIYCTICGHNLKNFAYFDIEHFLKSHDYHFHHLSFLSLPSTKAIMPIPSFIFVAIFKFLDIPMS